MCGYSESVARSCKSHFNSDELLRVYVQTLMDAVADELHITAATVLRELMMVGLGDIRQLFDEHGKPKPIQDLTYTQQRMITGYEIKEIQGQLMVTPKIHDRVKVLELIGKHIDVQAFKELSEIKHITPPVLDNPLLIAEQFAEGIINAETG